MAATASVIRTRGIGDCLFAPGDIRELQQIQ
jgi:hypothetical protein